VPRSSVIVVGAGIIGCLIARELAERDPAAEVTVLDQDMVGSGATRRSAGLHLPRGATPRTRAMSAASQEFYERLLAARPELPIYPVAATVVTGPERRGRPVSGCHHADVYLLTQALAADLRARAVVRESVPVTGLTAEDGQVTVRTATGERLRADRVVLAPGPWLAAPAWRELVAPLGLRVKKVVALHLDNRHLDGPQAGPDSPVTVFEDEDAFLLPLPRRGHWLFSFTSPEWDVRPDALAGGLSAADAELALACLGRCAPGWAGSPVSGRVFCDAYSPDREPVVAALDDAGRIVFAGAANGSGYRLGPAIAAEAATLLLRQPATARSTR
jgi:D-arginine dehydrogenase